MGINYSQGHHHRSTVHLFILAVHLVLLDHLSAGQAAVVDDSIHVGPGGELPLPVCDGGKGSDNKEWALDASSIYLREQCDGLDGLPQTHLVCQDTVLPNKQTRNQLMSKYTENDTYNIDSRFDNGYLLYQLNNSQLTPSSWYSLRVLLFLYSRDSSSFFHELGDGLGWKRVKEIKQTTISI